MKSKIELKYTGKNPDMTFWDKGPPNVPLSVFLGGHLLLDMQPTFKSGLFPQWDSLEKSNLLFASGSQLEKTFGLGVGTCVCFSQV